MSHGRPGGSVGGTRFFLDRGLGSRIVPRALREATVAGDVLLCKDLAIARNTLEAQVVYMTSARAFALAKADLAGPDMAQWHLASEAKIVAAALGASGPYVMAVNPSYGLRRLKLAYPPE